MERRGVRTAVKTVLSERMQQLTGKIEKPTVRRVEALTWIAKPLVERGEDPKETVHRILDRGGWSY